MECGEVQKISLPLKERKPNKVTLRCFLFVYKLESLDYLNKKIANKDFFLWTSATVNKM